MFQPMSVKPHEHINNGAKNMNISPVMTIICDEVVTATPAPRGGFWMARIQGERAAFFGRTATEAFYKARLWIVGDYQGVAA